MNDLVIRITDKLFINDDCRKMEESTMIKIFTDFSYIKNLTIIGGEIMLSYEEINKLIQIIHEYNVQINHIKLLTTGTIYDERIYKLLYNYFGDEFSIGLINSDKLDELIDVMFPSNNQESIDPCMNPQNSKDVINNMKKHFYNSHSIGWVNEIDFENISYIDIDGNLIIRGNNRVTEKRQAMFDVRKDLFHSMATNSTEDFIKKLNYNEYMRK